MLEVMPALKKDEEGIEIGVIPADSKPSGIVAEATPTPAPVEAAGNLLDFDLMLDPTPAVVEAPTGTSAPIETAPPVQVSTE